MDNNYWGPPQVGEPAMDGGAGDWRSQLHPDSRQRIVSKIMDTLKRHLPFSGQEGLQELKKIAVRFEEKIYSAATSQSDYLRKISLKMLTMETKSHNAGQSDSARHSNRPATARLTDGWVLRVLMDNNYWGPPQVGEPAMDGGAGDWRSQLQPDLRQRIVNKIMDTLKRHLPFSGQEGLQELNKIALRFEEKIYSAATSQSDYLRKISLKMLTMESKSQNAGQSNPADCWVLRVLMDNNYWGPPQVGEPAMDGGAGDWRSQLQPDSRQRIVNKIMDTLKRHFPFSGQEGLQDLKKIAVRFEENVYSAATSQSDYLRKISLKMPGPRIQWQMW